MITITARRAAYNALLKVERGAYANLALKKELDQIESQRDIRFAAALFYTTLEHQIYIDYVIGHYAKGGIKTAVRCVLRMGVCQLLYMEVPESGACDEAVKLMKQLGKTGAASFVNGVMRAIAREKDSLPMPIGQDAQTLSIKYSWPLWLVERFIKRFGYSETEKLFCFEERDICIRENPFKAFDKELITELDNRGLSYSFGKFVFDAIYVKGIANVANDEFFTSGKYTVQSESSMLVSKVAAPVKGMRVLDACAAPGGKSLYMAALMGEGTIVAWDLHEHRVDLIRRNAQRMGIEFIETGVCDASQYCAVHESAYDVVLVDAPCSGLGVFSGKPDIKYSKSPEIIEELAKLQLKILNNCSHYVKKGGALVYATCTISQEENEDVIAAFLSANSNFKAADISAYLPDCVDKERIENGGLQLLPHIDGIEGFFFCRMVHQ